MSYNPLPLSCPYPFSLATGNYGFVLLSVSLFFVIFISLLYFSNSVSDVTQHLSLFDYFTEQNAFQVHPCCCRWQSSILFLWLSNKGPSSQGYGFSSGHVWMWELDYKESWVPKNWCFWTESPLDCKEIQPVHPKGDQSWVFFGRTDVEAETPILWPPDAKSWLIVKDPDSGKDWGQEEKGMAVDEMAGWHHRLNGHEFG